MTNLTRAEAAGFLLSRDNFCILTHRRPDGDAVGSAAALCLGLRQMGKRAWVLDSGEFTEKFRFLLDGLVKSVPEAGDTVVSVDVAAPGMLPKAFDSLRERVELRLDHHASGTPYALCELVDGGSASCAEVVCDVMTILGIQLDKAIAEAVYVGASTDTGCFRFANTTAHTFMVAAVCAQAGADIHGLNQRLFETNSLAKLRLQSWMVEHMHIFGDGKFSIVAIPRSVEEELGVTDDDTENLSSFPRTVAGVCMAATLRQTKDGITKLSLRAVPGYDAAAVCEKFGGGGHKGAAGGSSPLPLEEVAKLLETYMLEA